MLSKAESNNIWAATWQNQQNGWAPNEDSDQPGHPPSLIRVFAVRMKKSGVLSYPLSAQRRLIRLGGCPGWSEPSLCAHPFCWFCHVAADMVKCACNYIVCCSIIMELEGIRVVSPTFPFAPESFRPLSLSPRVVSPPGRFAHFPVRPWVVSPPYKKLFLVLFRPQKCYKALIFFLIDDFAL